MKKNLEVKVHYPYTDSEPDNMLFLYKIFIIILISFLIFLILLATISSKK